MTSNIRLAVTDLLPQGSFACPFATASSTDNSSLTWYHQNFTYAMGTIMVSQCYTGIPGSGFICGTAKAI